MSIINRSVSADSIPIVSIDQVSKTFRQTHAVDGISFQILQGQTFALLGPNGAGKSTLVRMILEMLLPDHGSIRWFDPAGNAVGLERSRIGYLPEDRGLYKSEPVGRILSYFGELHGMSPQAARESANGWLERLQMTQHLKAKLETLSKGNQQKIQIAAALVHHPQLAILDEPFSGLDPLNQEMLVGLLDELKAEGVTILLSAHQLNLVERMADRVLLMNRGREVLSGSIAQIQASHYGGRVLEVEYKKAIDNSTLERLRQRPDVVELHQNATSHLRLLLANSASFSDWLAELANLGSIDQLNSSQLGLHEIYLRALQNQNIDQKANTGD